MLHIKKQFKRLAPLLIIFSMVLSTGFVSSAQSINNGGIHLNDAYYDTTICVGGNSSFETSPRLYDGNRIGIDFNADVYGTEGYCWIELLDCNDHLVAQQYVDPHSVHIVFDGTHYGYYHFIFYNGYSQSWVSHNVTLWSK